MPSAPGLLLARLPVLLWFTGRDRGLNLGALGSGPDALPRELGHSVLAPPPCQLAGLLGQLRPADRLLPEQHHPPDSQAVPGPGPAPSHLGPGWAQGGHTPLDTSLEAWLPPCLLGPAHPWPCWPHRGPRRPRRPGCPGWEAGHKACRRACGGRVPSAGGEGLASGLHRFQSLPGGIGGPNARRDTSRVTQSGPLFCASRALLHKARPPETMRPGRQGEPRWPVEWGAIPCSPLALT